VAAAGAWAEAADPSVFEAAVFAPIIGYRPAYRRPWGAQISFADGIKEVILPFARCGRGDEEIEGLASYLASSNVPCRFFSEAVQLPDGGYVAELRLDRSGRIMQIRTFHSQGVEDALEISIDGVVFGRRHTWSAMCQQPRLLANLAERLAKL
jgi:hypothetical protein